MVAIFTAVIFRWGLSILSGVAAPPLRAAALCAARLRGRGQGGLHGGTARQRAPRTSTQCIHTHYQRPHTRALQPMD
jgi:hypothetical protein